MGKLFDISLVWAYMPKILSRFPVTLLIVSFAVVVGSLLGLAIGLARIYRVPILNRLSIFYVSFIRGTPVIIQLFIVYYGLPLLLNLVGIDINRWNKLYFVLATYALNNAAFMSEIVRSSVASVAKGQVEAAYSVGLTRWQTMHRIVLPQAFVTAFPAFGTRIISVLESTSLAFTLGILDMIGQVEAIGNRTYHVLEGYVVVAIVFVGASVLLEKSFKQMERRLVLNRR